MSGPGIYLQAVCWLIRDSPERCRAGRETGADPGHTNTDGDVTEENIERLKMLCCIRFTLVSMIHVSDLKDTNLKVIRVQWERKFPLKKC